MITSSSRGRSATEKTRYYMSGLSKSSNLPITIVLETGIGDIMEAAKGEIIGREKHKLTTTRLSLFVRSGGVIIQVTLKPYSSRSMFIRRPQTRPKGGCEVEISGGP
jgi:hypothetical protein